MRPNPPPFTAIAVADPRERVLALRNTVMASLGFVPGLAWLFEPHPALAGLAPAGGAWLSASLALLALKTFLKITPAAPSGR
jgi:hypothetical protein